MKREVFSLLLAAVLALSPCSSYENAGERQTVVAGKFYPLQKEELESMLQTLFSKAVPRKYQDNVRALVVPHAGYVYSGEVAASGFNQLSGSADYENVFIIGPSHHLAFDGAIAYSEGDFKTPLGVTKVNTTLASELGKTHRVFAFKNDAHLPEHSIEVQLPFLQYKRTQGSRIVPILIGTQSPSTCKKIAEALRPHFTPRNLFIFSTDFSHYPAYGDAVRVDKATGEAVVSKSPDRLLEVVNRYEAAGIPNLATCMCGISGVLTLLYLTRNEPSIALDILQYKNSGDSEYGEKTGVVGYYAIAVVDKGRKEGGNFNVSEPDRRRLLALARTTIRDYVTKKALPHMDGGELSRDLKAPAGAFVTLHKGRDLRGCIGRFDAQEPLYKVVQQMAVAAATEDPRFPIVSPEEVDNLEIEISVLTPMRKVHSVEEIQLGKHGIYIKKGNRGGTFLPQVATETGWSKEEFLGHCAQDKAGIGWDGWKEAEIYVYEALVFGEKDLGK